MTKRQDDKSTSKTPTLNPGDQGVPGTPGIGENICRECRGTGKIGARDCPNCGGTGKVYEEIGGA